KHPEVKEEVGQLPMEIGLMLIASIMVFSALFGVGFWIYGETIPAIIATAITIAGGVLVYKGWKKMR
ncbi:hypothetical protein, partial [Winogradskyella psychrotolerans]